MISVLAISILRFININNCVWRRRRLVVIADSLFFLLNTVLHGIQTQSSDENSVRPAVKRVICDKTKE